MAKRYQTVGRGLPSEEADEHPKLWATNGDSEASTSKTITFEKEVGESRNWVEGLPHDVTVAILQKVGVIDILENVQHVCPSWHEICQDPALWRSIDMSNINHSYTSYEMFEIIKQAIDRSCGQLIDINLKYYCNDNILKYITDDRKNQVRRLKLVSCRDITNYGLSEAAKMMPSMEELHLQWVNITEVGLENVGRSCPGLKSLTHNRFTALINVDDPNSEALAISRTMPQLRHLSLVGNSMTNTGLQAILDACPHLELLDLRKCNNVDLSGELGKICSSIKTFHHPNEFVGKNEGGRFFDDDDDNDRVYHYYYYHSDDNDVTGFISDYEGFLY
ncbi:putative F-box/LRR-repeat protein 23 isoform X3 [Impatiens glandulifera]|uniref:putative F-box/LRR-repeat protein 23 isoform X3 n=1 Tax=Impatiens glandulifera TaxID=253017 RepID=UPI001FB0AEEC|nr:putative F-box/LRR-repeat protein 23 isoform X3 [Impatiens glandulifera]